MDFSPAWNDGQSLNWETVIKDLISQYQDGDEEVKENGHIPERVIMANEALFEPLSERELEVC